MEFPLKYGNCYQLEWIKDVLPWKVMLTSVNRNLWEQLWWNLTCQNEVFLFPELPSHDNILHLNRTLKMCLDVKRWSRVHHTVEPLMHLLRDMPSQFKKLHFTGSIFLQCLKQEPISQNSCSSFLVLQNITLKWWRSAKILYRVSINKAGKIVDPHT